MNSSKAFLSIQFCSACTDATLQTIEICGLPGCYTKTGKLTVDSTIESFFKDYISEPIFRQAYRLRNRKVETLKIWLYDRKSHHFERGYFVPELDERDLAIPSNPKSSKLDVIYVLDNELTGEELEQWQDAAHQLFSPLFGKFILPSKHPLMNGNIIPSLNQLVDNFYQLIDPKLEVKKQLIFDALIIQIN
ncbi:MAG: hypothetical protein JJU32_19750 [Phormidium sp. BM_Day4_Bin.17]|nr:hypothetical protein [Phormidium sp. BM_Day4_Bin.17]UCJ10684.1 MAG: hypothetical protein JWS08_12640 [Phormidium sp. PBR-2020]